MENGSTAGGIIDTNKKVLQMLAYGALVGAIIYGVTWLLQTYIMSRILCGDVTNLCYDAAIYSNATAMVFSGIAMLFLLVRLRIFRPLLVVLAVSISLWSIAIFTVSMEWFNALAVYIALFGLAYALFAWIARIKNFWLALIVTIVVTVLLRMLMVY